MLLAVSSNEIFIKNSTNEYLFKFNKKNYQKIIDGLTFIWITNGIGQNNAKLALRETFYELDTLYNINSFNTLS